jgi:Gpi18-like mannosyltransferase
MFILKNIKNFWKNYKKIIIFFIFWWILINSFAFLSIKRLDLKIGLDKHKPLSGYGIMSNGRYVNFYSSQEKFEDFTGMHARRQSRRHLDIAQNGYNNTINSRLTNLVYFPLYPLMINLVASALKINYILAGFLISNICLFISVVFFYKLLKIDFETETSKKAILFMLVFPTSFFFTMIYTESLFLLLSVLVFYFAIKKRWFLVGILGFLAATTRVTGILLLFPVLWEYFHAEKKVKPNIIYLSLIPFGLISFFTYHWYKYGSFFILFEAQKNWGRQFFNINNFLPNYSVLPPLAPEMINFYIEVFFVFLAIIACFFAFKFKIRKSYFIYLLLGTIVPILTGSLESMPRYILVLFPMYIVFVNLIKKYNFFNYYLITSVLLLSFFTTLIVNYFWVS